MYKLYFFICICLVSCSVRYSPEIEEVLQQACGNRHELEKVLKHYKRQAEDSLKLRAAEFLIVNMPGKYSEYYDAPWNDVTTVRLRWTSSPDKQNVLDVYGLGKKVRREDIKYITSKYLINNIDLAFKVWRERPWGKHIPFDVFCEEILPYRLNTEPLENWREKVLASFAALDTVLNKPDMTSVDACQRINDLLPRFRMDSDFSFMSYSQLMASTRGTCEASTSLTAFVMRALGVPVTIESTPRWVLLPSGHTWNTVRDSTGRHISFMGTETKPGELHQGNRFLKSKVYRKMFAKQRNIMTDKQNIPPLLQNVNSIKDVSAEYADCVDTVIVPLKYPARVSTGYVYLAFEHNGNWYPVAWSADSGQTACFASVGRNIVYRPMYYENGVATPAGDTFLVKMKTPSAVHERKNLLPKGLWLFNDSSNFGKAELGKPLLLNGTGIAAAGEGAVRVSKDSYFHCNHGIAATKNRIRVNEYTLMIDLKINKSERPHALLQTDLANHYDGALFINPNGQMGRNGYYTDIGIIIPPDRWNRYVVTIKCGAGEAGVFRQYLNGVLLNEISAGHDDKLNVDDCFSLNPAGCLLFTDNDDEDSEIFVDAVAIWDRALSIGEVTACIGKTGVYDWAQ